MRPHIFLATPCYGGVVTQGYMQSVCGLMAAAPAMGLDLTLGLLGQDALITRCRNTLVGHFMANPRATHILFVDADISFEPDDVLRLLRFRQPLVAGMYPLKTYDWSSAAVARQGRDEAPETAGLHYVGELQPRSHVKWVGGFVTATFAGTGFMMIERDTIRQMAEAYPETRYRHVHAHGSVSHPSTETFALFDCLIDPDSGTYMSEDFTFCRRWTRLGGEVWLDTSAQLTHTGPSDFRGVPATRFVNGN